MAIALLTVSLVIASTARADADGTLAEFRTPTALVLYGDVALTSSEITILDQDPLKTFHAQVTVLDLEIVRVTVRTLQTPVGPFAYAPDYKNTTHTFRDASLTFTPGLAPTLYAHLDGTHRISLKATDNFTLDPASLATPYSYGMNSSLPFFYRDNGIPNALSLPASHHPTHDHRGDGEVLFASGQLEIRAAQDNHRIQLGERHSTTRHGPGHSERIETYTFARALALDLRAHLIAPDQTQARLATVHWNGTLAATHATGLVTTGFRQYPLTQGSVTLEGTGAFAFPTPDAGERHYAIEGSFTQITFHDSRGAVHPRSDTATIASALAALLLLTPLARQTLGSLAAAMYTRLHPQHILTHPKRSRLLHLIRTQPGTHLRELQRQLPCGWGELHYHLGVLHRAGTIKLDQDGKHTRAYTYDCTAPKPAMHLQERGAALTVYNAILPGAAVTQRELIERTRLSRQLLSHHLKTLERDGLISTTGARPKLYARAASEALTKARA